MEFKNIKDPLKKQEGGDHYTGMRIQPALYISQNKMSFFEGSVIKYISRHKEKGGAEDIKKAIHYCELILAMEYQEL